MVFRILIELLAPANICLKIEGMNDDQLSAVLVENTSLIHIGEKIIIEDQLNSKMVKGFDEVALNANSGGGNVINHIRNDILFSNETSLMNDENDTLVVGVRSEDVASGGANDEPDGAWMSKLYVRISTYINHIELDFQAFNRCKQDNSTTCT